MEFTEDVMSSGVIRSESYLKRVIWAVLGKQIGGGQNEREETLQMSNAVGQKWAGK